MKEFKTNIINAVIEKAETERMVSLYDTAVELGHKHIAAQDVRDIMSAVLKALPDYRAVQMLTPAQMRNPSSAGLFTTLCFVDRELEFDGQEVL